MDDAHDPLRREEGAYRQYSTPLSQKPSAGPGGMHWRPNAAVFMQRAT